MLALGGLSLPELLQANPTEGQKSVILFWMWGGPSQFETFDPKPQAPSDYRGPFRAISSPVSGLELCEVFPKLAALGSKISLIRSLHHEMASHNDGSIEVLTGKTPSVADPTSTARSEHPDFGMVASRILGSAEGGMPPYVGIPRQPFMTQPAYLGLSHKAFETGDPSAKTFNPRTLSLGAGVDGTRLEDRRSLLSQMDRLKQDLDQTGSLLGTEGFREQAFSILTSNTVTRAFDLTKESDATRDRYGRHLWGQSFLLAKKLAISGVRVITIDALAPTLSDRYFSWDDHINVTTRWDLADAMRYRAPFMDQGLSALIEDLYHEGLDQEVMVVAMGEFGRTPRVVHADGLIGRDHWPQAMAALVSGGNLRMGQVVGATNSKGEYPAERPLSPKDLLATMYRHLGIDSDHSFNNFAGRPIPILNEGCPIEELI